MKKFPFVTSLLLAGAVAGLMSGTASFANPEDYAQIEKSVKDQLTALQVPTDHMGMLTMGQLSELTTILNGTDTDPAKAMAAEYFLDQAFQPSTIPLDSPDGIKMLSDLKLEFEKAGVPYPTQPLTAVQVQALHNVFTNHKKDINQKLAIEAVLASVNRPASVMTTNEGVLQMESQIDAKLQALGVPVPLPGMMTFEQLGKLEGVFNATTATDATKKGLAMTILGLN